MENIPDLDQVVVEALKFLETAKLPEVNWSEFDTPLVVGSGNAEVVGRILFVKTKAFFASESDCEEKLKSFPEIDEVIIVSASGEKSAPEIERTVNSYGKKMLLLTCNLLASVSNKVVFPKIIEPYTYNVSSYLGMILAKTCEDPKEILDFINKLSLPNLSGDKYVFIVPDKFLELRRMFDIKFMELFGRNVAVNVETESFIPHAVMLVPSDEKVIRFGVDVPLPEYASFGAMMAIGYFVIGKIQKTLPPYFKENIGEYCKKLQNVE